MDSAEVIDQPYDKNRSGLPRHDKTAPLKQAVLWHVQEPLELGMPEVAGVYPRGFVPWLARALQVSRHEILHVCSGSLPAGEGTRVDLRPEVRPDIVADGRHLPIADNSYAAVAVDPPYTLQYANDLYGTDYPRPSHLLTEAARVVRPGGRIAFVHYLVPANPPGTTFERCYGMTMGLGYRIRAVTIYRKDDEGLL